MGNLRFSLEEVLAVDKAIEMVQLQDSTDPLDVEKVKLFDEQLDEMKEAAAETAETADDTSFDSSAPETSTEPESTDAVENTETDTDSSSTDESSSDEDEKSDEEDVGNKDDDQSEDKSNESDNNEDEKEAEVAKENFRNLDHALEDLSYLIDARTALSESLRKGTTRFISSENFSERLSSIVSTYKLTGVTIPSLESFSTMGYSKARLELKTSLEGVKEFMKVAVEKVVAFIKRIISWLKDYFFFDPLKEREKDVAWRARRDAARELQRKTIAMQNFVRDAELAIGKKVYRDRANFLVIGNKNSSFNQITKDLESTVQYLEKYWKSTSAFTKQNIVSKMRNVYDFDQSATLNTNIDLAVVTAQNYNPVDLQLKQDYRTYSQQHLPKDFAMYVSKGVMCGNKRLAFIMPATALSDPIKDSNTGNYYSGLLVSDEDQTGVRKAISFTPEPIGMVTLADMVQKAFISKRNLSAFITEIIRFLNNASEKMINAIKDYDDQYMTRDVKSNGINALRYNLNVLNNFIDAPLIASVRYFDRTISAAEDLFDQNNKIISSVAEDIKDKKTELGLNT